MATRQQLEQQLVAAHRTGNVQAAQQAAYAIRQYDQSALSAQVPSINAPPPIERVPKPTFGSWLENVGIGIGDEWGRQIQGLGESVQRGVSAFAKDPLKASAAAFMTALEPARQGFTQPVQTAKGIGTGIAETVGQMGKQAASGPIGFGQVVGQVVDIPGPDLPGGKRRPTMAELDVYHGTPHTFEAEEGAPLGRFRSSKIGTGEGAQAYGYGLYLAEHPDVAGQYRQIAGHQGPFNAFLIPDAAHPELQDLSHKASLSGNHAAAWVYDELLTGDFGPEQLLRKASKEELPAVREALANAESVLKKHKGSLYKVDLPDAKIEQMLDWDKPISQQPAMQKAFNKFWKGLSKNERAQAVLDEFGDYDLAEQMAKSPGEVRGRLAYSLMTHHFGDPAAASDFLRQQGVPGIKYLDASSRDGGNGTRNFVVFPGEEQNLTILERDGVKAEVPKPDELAYHGTTKQAAAAIEREGFDLTRAADGTVWFTSNPNIGEVAATGKGGIVARSVSGLKLGGWDEMDKYSTDELIAKGYDGLRLKDGDEITYQIFNPEKLKVPTKKAK